MFTNAGNKIKVFARVWFIIQCVAAFIGCVAVVAEDEDMIFAGFLIMTGGFFVAWISSLLMFGFGEIVDTAIANRYANKKAAMVVNTVPQNYVSQPVAQNYVSQPVAQNYASQPVVESASWACPSCGAKNLGSRTTCWSCGTGVSENA